MQQTSVQRNIVFRRSLMYKTWMANPSSPSNEFSRPDSTETIWSGSNRFEKIEVDRPGRRSV